MVRLLAQTTALVDRPARTGILENTISGLPKKPADLHGEAERIRDRLAEITNDIDAVDRILGTLGYTGDLDAEMPRQKRHSCSVAASLPAPSSANYAARTDRCPVGKSVRQSWL